MHVGSLAEATGSEELQLGSGAAFGFGLPTADLNGPDVLLGPLELSHSACSRGMLLND